ncbi:hypothetical protein [uncultured Mediterranean phage uvMED]|nr:hypothetical protein [uncultured Mediterranean phage uvMED]
MQKTETLTFQINKNKVKVVHEYASDTGKPFKDQKGGVAEVKKWIYDEIVFQQKQKGWCTYNNFESSFNWEIIKKNNSVVYNTKADPVTKITEIKTNDDGSKSSDVIYQSPGWNKRLSKWCAENRKAKAIRKSLTNEQRKQVKKDIANACNFINQTFKNKEAS